MGIFPYYWVTSMCTIIFLSFSKLITLNSMHECTGINGITYWCDYVEAQCANVEVAKIIFCEWLVEKVIFSLDKPFY